LSAGCAASPIKKVGSAARVIIGDELAPRHFGSQAEIRASIRATSRSQSSCVNSAYYGGRSSRARPPSFGFADEGVAMSPPPPSSAPTVNPAQEMSGQSYKSAREPRYSRTNVQHRGIDESHIIKTDGRFIYTVSESSLFIVDVRDGKNSEVAGSVVLPGRASGMFIAGDRVMVIGRFVDRNKLINDSQHDKLSYVIVFDVRSRRAPRLLARHVLEGRFVDARLIDGVAYFVLRSRAYPRSKPAPVLATASRVRHVAATQTFAYRQPRQAPSFATVHALRLSRPKKVSSKAVLMGNPTVVYMSARSLYLADTASANASDMAMVLLPKLVASHLTSEDSRLIRQIENVDGAVVSTLEKRDKIMNVYCDRLDALEPTQRRELRRRAKIGLAEQISKMAAHQVTAIHRVDIDGTSLRLGPSGTVPGRPLNQFAFDEYNGILRVATTRRSDNAVFAMNAELDTVGKLEGLGKNERIYAVRYMGERVYLVTFRQIDPFYVIDASVPTDLRKLGELKIPGVSRYLHPYGHNKILGIGSKDGARRGLKISLFDVSDVSAPRESARLTSDEFFADLQSAHSHRALLIDRYKRLLTVPVGSSKQRGLGTLVVDAAAHGFEERGVIFHADEQLASLGTQNIEGTVYVDNLLFTKSPAIVRATALGDLSEVATVFLK